MKTKLTLLALASVCALSTSASATIYVDSQNDLFDNGFAHLDISSMEVTNDASTITFKFNLRGDPVATDWGKYMVIMDTAVGGDPVSNGWVRPISMPSGADHWLGSWVDGGNGLEVRSWDGAAWQLAGATYNGSPLVSVSKDGSSVTLNVGLSYLGVGAGDTILFDAFSSGGGGGDGAVDSAGNPNMNIANWGDHSNATPMEYQLTPVPEPASMAALALGAIALIRKRRKN